MTVRAFDEKSRGSYKSGGEGRHGADWTSTPPPTRDNTPDPHHVTSTVPRDFRSIPGWGVDLHERPMFPMELPSDVMNVRGDVKDWQVPYEKVHVSIEHPNLTPVFGVSCPPRGLSGALRNYAYKYGEGTNRHWMTLLFADRVDVVESMIIDALRGHPDRYIKEKGGTFTVATDDADRRTRYLTMAAMVIGAVAVGAVIRTAFSED
ncbi:MAG TPA: hypothetical protein VF824_22450 [Thermoanaerobaculia bacterium]|jgi:hypothetical protein